MIACWNDIEVIVDLYGFGLRLSCDFSVSKKFTVCLVRWKINLHFAFYMEEETLLIGSNTLELGD